ncbi:hypothetical protein PoB_002788700 [Plakobranchus ocellatus]|uniref:Uncharacterized protein n=1 Tax=Plakobranchus ocellatus TaxID=259542 RepID=A0AAV4A3C6_9GAST|nr:hypothetical protein PoB_002788700 [Plakobranchus ocellatus]
MLGIVLCPFPPVPLSLHHAKHNQFTYACPDQQDPSNLAYDHLACGPESHLWHTFWVTVSVGPHWKQQFTCPIVHVLKYSLSLVRGHIMSAACRSVGAILCVLQPCLTSVALLDKGRGGGGHYVTTHNPTDRCCANHEASLVTQIIRLTCRWAVHSNCDISPSS